MSIKHNWLVLLPVLSLAAPAADKNETVDKLLERIAQQERQFIQDLRAHSAILETYIQETPEPGSENKHVVRDHYFLGQLDFSRGLGYTPMAARGESPKSQKSIFSFRNRSTVFVAAGFAQMVLPDGDGLDRQRYQIDFVRREFLGEVRCLLFDVTPLDNKAQGRFKGRIWVEDEDFKIVRFNGVYTNGSASRMYFHFDSWRIHVAAGRWVPAFIYVEESGTGDKNNAAPRFKAQSRLWGYRAAASDKLQELASIVIEAEKPVKDRSEVAGISPLESQRSWERQAAANVLDRLQKSGLLAPAGSVDEVLNTVVNNLIVTNNLGVEVKCRVLLTTPLETFSVGQTIVISRGLIDVLPDEASLAMILATELAHIALGHRTDTHFAFSDRTMLNEGELLHSLQFVRPPAEIEAAAAKAVELISNSPYKANLSNVGLFMKALDSRADQLPNLIRANLGNGLTSAANRERLGAFAEQARVNDQEKLEQIVALPLGSRVQLDPWTNDITLVKAKPVPLISSRDKLPFEITPFMIYLSRADRQSRYQDPAPAQ